MGYMIELLAPAGSKEALIAAIEGGADAIYLSGQMFGARAYAANFDEGELESAVRFAHLRDIKVYVTVNTLVDDTEMRELTTYLRHLYEIGVDAIIVQDLGVASLAKKVVPLLPLHASTQMTVHNLEGVEFLAECGFERVVLSRELSLEEIRFICSNTSLEIEVFGHGALCISYSGQCLMSSMIGGRSGNRGRCAQPCRLPYSIIDKAGKVVEFREDAGEYLLSPKDLNTLELLPELIKAGVKSFKIEGRMKRAEYVAVVVDTYRRAIDAYWADCNHYRVDIQEQKNLAQIFNRDFTSAYLLEKQGRKMMSDRRPNNRGVRIGRVTHFQAKNKLVTIKLDEPLHNNDIVDFWVKVGGRVSTTVQSMMVNGKVVEEAAAGEEVTIGVGSPVKVNDRVFKVFDATLMEKARSFFKEAVPKRRVKIDAMVKVAVGEPFLIVVKDEDGFTGMAKTGFIAENARNRPLTEEGIRNQIDRLGSTIFSLRNFACDIEGQIMVPVSEINDARRRAIEELEKARLARFQRKVLTTKDLRAVLPQVREKNNSKTLLTINVDTVEKVKMGLDKGADIVIFGGETFNGSPISNRDYEDVLASAKEKGKSIIFNTPRITKHYQMNRLREELQLFESIKPDAIAVGNLGVLKLVKEHTALPIHGEAGLNTYNSLSVDFFAQKGLESLTLSPELTFGQIEEIVQRSAVSIECLVHGYLTLMLSEYCALGSFLGDLHTGKCSCPCSKGGYWLKDRKGELFPIAMDQFCRMHILNAKELSMIPHVNRFVEIGVSRIRIEGKKMNAQQLGDVTKLYKELLELGEQHPLFIGDKLKLKEHEDITRGHYFRGVL